MRQNSREPAQTPVAAPFTEDSGASVLSSISPDGKFVVYSSDRAGEGHFDLWLKQVQGGAPLRLTREPGDESWATFSPDGTQIAFLSARDGGSIRLMPVLGGGDRMLVARAKNPQFSPDGTRMLYIEEERNQEFLPMHVISVSGGSPSDVAPGYVANQAFWSPDGRHILFRGGRRNSGEQFVWQAADTNGGAPAPLGAEAYLEKFGNQYPRFWCFVPNSGSNPMLVFSGATETGYDLWTIRISLSTFKLTGEPERLTDGESDHAFASVSNDGTVLFTSALPTGISGPSRSMPIAGANSARRGGSHARLRLRAFRTSRRRPTGWCISRNGSVSLVSTSASSTANRNRWLPTGEMQFTRFSAPMVRKLRSRWARMSSTRFEFSRLAGVQGRRCAATAASLENGRPTADGF